MLSLLESDYPRDIIERQINRRLIERLFRSWWGTGEGDYLAALYLLQSLKG
jgi:hypothetical protein